MAKDKSALEKIAELEAKFQADKAKVLDAAKDELVAEKQVIKDMLDTYNGRAAALGETEFELAHKGWRTGNKAPKRSGGFVPLTPTQIEQGKKLIKDAGKAGVSPRTLNKQTAAVANAIEWVAALGDGYTTNGKKGGGCKIMAK